MKRTTLLVTVGVTVLALLALVVGAALATTPSGVTATPLTRATLGEFKAKNDGIKVKSVRGSADIAIVKLEISPGGSTGWHHHPGVVMVAVDSGSVTEYDAQCHPTVIDAGNGFVESKGEVHLVRNEGDVKAVLYATFLIPTATPPGGQTISDPQPQECDKL
jgi:quercetin dioxygenase-like cupin family protein